MVIETYEIEGLDSEAPEITDENRKMAEELGLTGQLGILGTNEEPNDAIPYRAMTDVEYCVYKAVMPMMTKVTEYKRDVMPIRILQVVAHALELDCFDEVQVWYPKLAEIKDPVLVGRVGENEWSDRTYYLMARWGEALESFEELSKLAAKILRTQYDTKVAEVRSGIAGVADGSSYSDEAFIRGMVKTPTFYA